MKVLLFANTDWYLYNFRLPLAQALQKEGHEVLLLSPDGPYGEKLRKLGFKWSSAPMNRRSLNPIKELNLLYWLHHFVRLHKVDLIHCFTIKCAIYGSSIARLSGIFSVNAVAGMGYVFTSNHLKASFLRPFVRLLFKVSFGGKRARLVLQNPDDFTIFRSANFVPTDCMFMIPGSGVNCERFHPIAKPSGTQRTTVLLPARILWDKGVGEYVSAAQLLIEKGLPVTFLLAGDRDTGNPSSVQKETLNEWVKHGWVQWLGHVDDMATLYQSVDMVALPSYREGLPKGLIEAGACGLPLIATDAPGCREVV